MAMMHTELVLRRGLGPRYVVRDYPPRRRSVLLRRELEVVTVGRRISRISVVEQERMVLVAKYDEYDELSAFRCFTGFSKASVPTLECEVGTVPFANVTKHPGLVCFGSVPRGLIKQDPFEAFWSSTFDGWSGSVRPYLVELGDWELVPYYRRATVSDVVHNIENMLC